MNRFTRPPFRGPLSGLKVIELGSDISLAFGARLLADLGAEVIKVEAPAGDPLRREAPLTPGGESALFAYLNRGKALVSIDGGTADGWQLLGDLAGQSDLVLSTDDAVRGAEPDWAQRPATLVVSAQGLSGPSTGRPTSSFIQQHASGFAFHQASPVTDPEATPPVGCADWEGDMAGGLVVAIAALWALEAAAGARPGPLVDLSHEDLLVYMLVEPFADWQAGMDVTDRRRDPAKGLTIAGGLVWYLPCADGAVMVSPREDHQWARWCEVMGSPDWTRDAELCGDRVVRTNNAAKLQELMARWSVTQRNRDVVEAAKQARVACFPVSTPRDLIENVQLRSRRFFDDIRFTDGTVLPMPSLPFRFVSQRGEELARGGETPAPGRPDDGRDLLATLLAARDGSAERSAVGGL
ncbi:CoA transferase [Starkeya koreensis]|uniref:CoA transferase n=1 Tax=Ancylobacter koreensis TaxID=266121 RepID=A0ABT0DRN4_9HYPH|nr:CoA transferase [Ancylobacter koreensis]MCK0209946.1 CoA transferase [Ancylobacter koreensis]